MSANFIDVRFPPLISFGAEGGPEFQTDIVITASGRETRNQNWSRQRMRYDVAHAARREPQWRQLQAFFLLMAGRAKTFRFKDWTDYQCNAGDGVFLDTDEAYGSPTGKQMYKVYRFAGQTYYRKITKPISGAITVSGGGTLDYSTGIVESGSPSSWYGEFDVHARFDTDEMRSETITKSGDEFIVGWRSIPIVEVDE